MKTMRRFIYSISVATAIFYSCNQTVVPDPALYEELGSLNGVKALVDSFLVNIEANDSINMYFTETFANAERKLGFRNHLVNQFCQLSGGPCAYNGKIMASAHAGMQISSEQFDAIMEDLEKALVSLNISAENTSELLFRVAELRMQIVGK